MNRLKRRSVDEYQFSDWGFIKWLKSRKKKKNKDTEPSSNKQIKTLKDLHKRSAKAAVINHKNLQDEITKNIQLESNLDYVTKQLGKVHGENVQLANDLHKLKGEYGDLSDRYKKVNNDLEDTTKKLDKSDKAKSKFKKLAIGLGIGAGATAIGAGIGAGVLGSKYINTKRRMNSMNNTISRLSNSWIGRHALKRANR